ncbi:MAG TPA: HEAT repeat domain-containing protein [Thermoanaerobaculia bacterium]|nr:HEAT repeat domain-containing protein [Thermoanaerobaculia bacterium]
MRKLAPIVLLLGIACTTAPPPPPASIAATAEPYGMTVEEEARVLRLEDRREFDPALVAQWVAHPNAIHRARIATALGRIGPHTFIDQNGNNELDTVESPAGVAELIALTRDPDRNVRERAAFALGEIAAGAGADALFGLTTDTDAGVAAEAIEALSKLAGQEAFMRDRYVRYVWMTDASQAEGVRARAVRFLFRFNTDEASQLAMQALASPSSAVRQEGAYTLARRAYTAARGPLELVLSDPNVLTRAYAATALGRIGDPASAPLLVNLLGDSHPWVRTNAAVALGRVFEKDASGARADDLPRIFATLDDPDPGVRSSILDPLGYYAKTNETAKARLLSVLVNGTSWDRETAAGAVMKHLGRPGFVGTKFSRTPWIIVRQLETANAPSSRRQAMQNENPLVRTAALSTIPVQRADLELEVIQKGLQDPDVIVRANAIEKYTSVTSIRPSDWLATLHAAVEKERTSEMNDARVAAIVAIAAYNDRGREPFLRGLLTDNDPVVRRVAADQLVEKLGAKRPQITPLPVNRPQSEYEEIVRWSRKPHTATIHMTRGRIELALLTQDAPMTAWNFAQLAGKKYFDNSSFMRVVPNFVIQGGDPRNDMNGGPGYFIRDEINLQKYTRGAVGMALSGPDTGGSQFFITHSPQPHLDGGYTIFGRVYDGMNGVVDQTERGDRVTTITIDERPPAGAEQIGSVPNVSLPLVVGTVTPDRLMATVPSYVQRKSEYQPDVTVVEMMKPYVRAGDRMEIYMGTWCDDSQREVPKMLRIADDLKSQFGVDLPMTFVAVDKSKQKPAELLKGKHIVKVATFIYYRGDEELGRIEERPQGVFEDDLLQILAKSSDER